MVNKKGDYKYGIILSLILGTMVLSLSLYFIFQELWSEDELDMEICRQSIQVRALAPEYKEKWTETTPLSFKDSYPLKCKTQIVNIEESDVKNIEDAQKIIAETMARCWALYDKGDSVAFPSDWYGSTSVCVPCARIHLTEDAKKYMTEEGVIGINIRDSLMDLKMREDYSYYEYLNNSGKKFPALNFGSSWPFNLDGDVFRLDKSWEVIKIEDTLLINRLSGARYSAWMINSVSLPMLFYSEKGDLIINYGVMVFNGGGNFGDYVPYLFYFQANQREPDPFNETGNMIFKGQLIGDNVALCNSWEGIPA